MTYSLLFTLEVSFWFLLLSGLLARYRLRHLRLSATLLALAPLADVALLGFTLADLSRGATATPAHALAAVFVALSVVQGHTLIQTLDGAVHRMATRKPLRPPPVYGAVRAQKERTHWWLHAGTFALASAMLLGAHAWVGAPARTEVFPQVIHYWSVLLSIDFLVSFSYTLWPKEAPQPTPPASPTGE
ncbi:hypothetical protein LAJ19_13980 (plasmid) [Deinococcus taeanensis]|uniref:hypothetical protein n=1 Tax=Deinococcus taeanensis TaxID=2737050 RepID=UPI001CDB5BF0|nr:hypothetical protein [Deinococcus taeanensis]UBV44280.1 hypothetical protein LAJ19_13980 [Deinococcus taeanensis]